MATPLPPCPDCGGIKANRYAERCWDCSKRYRSTRPCRIEGCIRFARARGMCEPHAKRERKGKPVDGPIRMMNRGQPCAAEDCQGKAVAKGMCRKHYARVWRTGTLELVGAKPVREPVIYLDRKGYRRVRVDGKEFKEHRLIMAELLGRPLLRSENVHHVNGVKDDNRTDGPLDEDFRSGNLELWTKSQPSGGRVVDKVAWAVELLETYAPELLAAKPTQLRLVS